MAWNHGFHMDLPRSRYLLDEYRMPPKSHVQQVILELAWQGTDDRRLLGIDVLGSLAVRVRLPCDPLLVQSNRHS